MVGVKSFLSLSACLRLSLIAEINWLRYILGTVKCFIQGAKVQTWGMCVLGGLLREGEGEVIWPANPGKFPYYYFIMRYINTAKLVSLIRLRFHTCMTNSQNT